MLNREIVNTVCCIGNFDRREYKNPKHLFLVMLMYYISYHISLS